jgi:hypothetical protein
MNWSLLLLFFLLFVLFLKTPILLKLRSARDAMTFYGVWALTLMVTIMDWVDPTLFRPLEWVRGMMGLLH